MTQPVPCPLWGFADQEDADPGSIMFVLAHESMHNEDLGLFLYIIDNMKKYFEEKGMSAMRINRLFDEMNRRMEQMPRAGKCLNPIMSNEKDLTIPLALQMISSSHWVVEIADTFRIIARYRQRSTGM